MFHYDSQHKTPRDIASQLHIFAISKSLKTPQPSA